LAIAALAFPTKEGQEFMPISVSGAGVKGFNDGSLFDIVENFDGFGGAQAALGNCENRGAVPQFGPLSNTVQLFGAAIGTAPLQAFDTTTGRNLITTISGAARNGQIGATGTCPRVPMAQVFEGANAIPIPFLRPLRRYTMEGPMRISVAGTAVLEAGFASTNGLLTLLGTELAYVWTSDPAVSGGAWRARYRRISAGGIVNQFQSAVSPANWHKLGWRYTEGATPSFEWLIDGVPVAIVTGAANLPVLAATATPMLPAFAVGTPAGTTMLRAAWRFFVEEIGA
jgi:hypothetical protein